MFLILFFKLFLINIENTWWSSMFLNFTWLGLFLVCSYFFGEQCSYRIVLTKKEYIRIISNSSTTSFHCGLVLGNFYCHHMYLIWNNFLRISYFSTQCWSFGVTYVSQWSSRRRSWIPNQKLLYSSRQLIPQVEHTKSTPRISPCIKQSILVKWTPHLLQIFCLRERN